MDSFELNKIAAAVFGSALFILVLTIVSDYLYSEPELEQQAYIVDLGESVKDMASAVEEIVEIDVMSLLILASAENGALSSNFISISSSDPGLVPLI